MVVFDLSVQNECQTDGEPRKNDERNGSLIPQGNKKRRGERNADDERSRADGAAVFRDVLFSDVPAVVGVDRADVPLYITAPRTDERMPTMSSR